MKPEQFQRMRRLEEKARKLPPEQRAAFLQDACPDDPEVRAAVEELLVQQDRPAEDSSRPTVVPTEAIELPQPDPSTEIGPYRIVRKLGEGGMGIVYEAEQLRPVRRRVALKLIKHGLVGSQVLARFESERQALALMNHPNVAKVLDAGTDGHGRPWFAMEYIKGDPITEYCDRENLTTRERLYLMTQVCDGAQHAHQKGIIHRDLKPTNILVEIQDGKPVPRVIDFGVAKAIDRQLTERTLYTEFGQIIGTPEYMSPEQAEMTGVDIDTRTDVYALGVVLYEMLVGALPFEPRELRRGGIEGMRRIIREQTPHKPSTRLSTQGEGSTDAASHRGSNPTSLARTCRGDLDWITMKALEKNRTRRYGSASDLAADIRHHLNNEPVLAGPPSVTYRMQKFVRRHSVGVSVTAALALAVVLGLAGTSINLVRALRAEQQARLEATTVGRISEFVLDMFDISDPGRSRGETITAREILDRGVERIDEELEEEPELRGRMLETMGRVYRELGLYKEAIPLLEQAVDNAVDAHGEQSPVVSEYLIRLGGLFIRHGRPDEAIPHLERALAVQKAVLEPDDVQVGKALNNLGAAHRVARRYEEALPYYEQALLVRERALGPDHPDVAKVLNNLSQVAVQLEDYDRAGEALSRAVEIRERALGLDHPDVWKVLSSIAELEYRSGDYAAARDVIGRLLPSQERVLGEDHPDVAFTLMTLAQVELRENDFAAARARYEQALAIGKAKLVPEHKAMIDVRRKLLFIAREQGDKPRAAELEREIIALAGS